MGNGAGLPGKLLQGFSLIGSIPIFSTPKQRKAMTTEEELETYKKLVRRIVVHANSFGDVHWFISEALQNNPELKENAPWFN